MPHTDTPVTPQTADGGAMATGITVILCTYNRCESLRLALNSVAQSVLPPSISWEVLVVDNNSHDQTREVAQEFIARYPGRFRYLFEPTPGKSHALNSGIAFTAAPILAFMDDDVQVDPHWLQLLTDPLVNGTWSGTGGRILPEAGFVPPRWLDAGRPYALAPLAVFDLGVEQRELTESPFGTNMAFRASMFAKHGGFRTDLGPVSTFAFKNEDTEFGFRLLEKGERFLYVASAVVYHAVPQARVKKSYFLEWWYLKARADIRQNGLTEPARWQLMSIPLPFYRRLLRWTFRWMLSLNAADRFTSRIHVWTTVGRMQECRRAQLNPAQIPASGHQP